MSSDREEIRRKIDGFIHAYNAGDVDRLMTLFAADLIDMSDGEPTLRGSTAHRETEARLRDTFAKFTGQLTVDMEELEISGDRAFDYGTLRVELHPKADGEPVVVERRFLEIWRRGPDGEWRVARAMDNSACAEKHSLDFRPQQN